MNLKKQLLPMLIMLAALVFAGCASNGNEDTEAKGENKAADKEEKRDELVVAISAGYEPFMFEENGEMKGYDHDILMEYEKRTGTKIVYENADFSGLLGLVESGRADVVAAQLTPTPEREENFAFTEPITYYGSTIVVHKDNEEIKSVKDLKGKTVGVGSGNEMQQKVEEMYEEGDINWEIYTSATLENMLQDVSNKRLDAMLAQDVQAYVAINKSGANAKVLPPFETSVGTLGVKKENTELLEELNRFIKEMKEDGTLAEISKKWIGEDISKPAEGTEQ